MRDKPLIAAPRELDRPLVLSHSRGLQSKGLLKKPAAASPCTASLVFSSQILESSGVRIQNAFFPSLRGSEATEAKQGAAEASLVIHKKVDSSMDRHADKSARDDRENADSRKTKSATNPHHTK